MSNAPNATDKLPSSVHSLAQVAAIEANAQRQETPCGDGTIVWHLWGTGQPVLLLHGGSGSWTHWVRNIPMLVDAGYQVVVPDLPGFGDSAAPPDGRDADVMPRWLQSGLQSLVGETACHVVGFSFGAMVGTLMCATYPTRAVSLTLVGGPALSSLAPPRLDLHAWDHLPPGPERSAILRHNLATLMLARAESIDEFALNLHEANLVRDRLKRRRLSRTDIVVRTLPDVQCQVHGIWGDKDAVYRERVHTIEPGLRAAPQFRSLELLADTGHWAAFESAAPFNQALARLLK